MKAKHLTILIIAPIIAIMLAFARVYYSYNIWQYNGKQREFTIQRGEGFASINGRLKRQHLIHSSKLLHRYCQFYKCLNKFKAGSYIIKRGVTTKNILQLLLEGSSINIKVTISEGKNLFEIAQILKNKHIIKSSKKFIKIAKSNTLLRQFNLPGTTLEGYLYPETYFFSKNTSETIIITKMISLFVKKVHDLNFSNSSHLNFYQVLTLASIVEKETGARFERPMIARVFLNRLKRNMRLQSDPTTIYGIFERYHGNLHKKDLFQKNKFNTYKIAGLPQTPISNPGLGAILAVLKPAKNNFLYFVSKNDGTHKFSSTYKEHIKAVKFFQKTRKNRSGRSWRELHQTK